MLTLKQGAIGWDLEALYKGEKKKQIGSQFLLVNPRSLQVAVAYRAVLYAIIIYVTMLNLCKDLFTSLVLIFSQVAFLAAEG